MHLPIAAIMDQMVTTPPASLSFPVTAMSKRRWMLETDAGPIVQLECLESPDRAIIFATTARDGSGPLRASFTTMLLLEDTIANAMQPYGVCSGDATVTIYQFVDVSDATDESISHDLAEFAHLAAAHLAKRGIGLPGASLDDDHDGLKIQMIACPED
jgi:hypothetical protein